MLGASSAGDRPHVGKEQGGDPSAMSRSWAFHLTFSVGKNSQRHFSVSLVRTSTESHIWSVAIKVASLEISGPIERFLPWKCTLIQCDHY